MEGSIVNNPSIRYIGTNRQGIAWKMVRSKIDNKWRNKRKWARCPIPTRNELKKSLEYFARRQNKTLFDRAFFYIDCCINDMKKSREIIWREKQRISKTKKCIRVAMGLLNREDRKEVKGYINARLVK